MWNRRLVTETTAVLVVDPYDIGELLDRITFGLDDELHRGSPRRGTGGNGDSRGGQPAECPDPVELILYVKSHSLVTAIAVENLRRTMAQLYTLNVRLTIRDGAENGATIRKEDGASSAAQGPQRPRTFILGHVTSPGLLLELLADCAQG